MTPLFLENVTRSKRVKELVDVEDLSVQEGKPAKWYSKRMVHVAAVVSGVFLLVIVAVVTGFVVMTKEHEKSHRRTVEVFLID